MEIRFEHVDFSYQKVNCTSKDVLNDINFCFSYTNQTYYDKIEIEERKGNGYGF